MEFLLLLTFIFLLGVSIGSFLNVLIDRLPFERSISGRSHCDYCQHQLSWYDLIPLVSFFILKGRCRYCKKTISWQYPLVEFLTGVSFLFVFLRITNNQSLIATNNLRYWLLVISYLGIASSLIVIFFADLKYHLIPDQVQIALFVFGLILLPFQGQSLYLAFANHVIAALLIASPIFFLHFFTKGKAMGFGDVKLAFNIGFLLGVKAGFLALYFAFLIGGVVGLILILLQRKKLKSKIAFGPFLVLGILIMLFWQREIFEVIGKIYGF